ncbi:MAG: MarR family winged helix-turn-helix transcriptional regulator [Desulfovibrionaceae bacterium]
MANDYTRSILWSLRRIINSIDKQNKQLSRSSNLTIPQLVCLRQLLQEGSRPIGALAKSVCLSKATLTGIIDRLEAKGLVRRERSAADRRNVYLSLSPEGKAAAENMPWPLQERFSASISAMSREDVEKIDASLKKILEMMEAPACDVWPYGEAGDMPADATVLLPETKEAEDE